MPRFEYRPRSATDLWLHMLDSVVGHDETLVTVLRTLGSGISDAASAIEKSDHLPDEQKDGIVDEECEIIESLLGSAYIVCQVQITAVTEAALGVRKSALYEGREFSSYGEKDHALRAMGDKFDGKYSKVELLWALGNFFKHRDEWDRDEWANPTGLNKYTIPVLLAAGLQASPSGNLRAGSKALGNPGFVKTSIFSNIVREWAEVVHKAARSALGR